MAFPVGFGENGGFIGMFKEESHEVIEIDKCLIADDKINLVVSIFKSYIKENFTGYDFKKCSGDIKYLVVRVSSDATLITLVVAKKVNLNGLYDILCKYLKNVGISLIISDNTEDILSGKYYHIDGIEYLEFNEFGLKYQVDNRGFLQVNDKIKHKLYSRVLENIDKDDIVIDGYSGAGLLSGIIAKKCKHVTGVEINHSACESARKLIAENNLNNIDYFEGDFKDYIDSCIMSGSVLVLDPPRSGCDGIVLTSILNAKNIFKIIYISCNPATLGRDLSVLKVEFDIKDITLFEMFPNTKHVETLVVLERRG
jgi:23S rRNA (uracil1939-C5)-methyltransferase